MPRFISMFSRADRTSRPSADARPKWTIPCGVGWSVGYFGLLVVLFQVLRLIVLWVNRELAVGVEIALLARCCWVGLRFDLAVAAYITLGQFLLTSLCGLLLRPRIQRRLFLVAAAGSFAVFALMGCGEAEFYREYFSRFNTLALHYWKQPATVLSAIWYGYPVLQYLVWVAGITLVFAVAMRRAVGRFPAKEVPLAMVWKSETLWGAAFLGLLLVVARGGVRGTPLKWGDAVHSESTFANHLALNGFWTLGQAALNADDHDFCADLWPRGMPVAQAQKIAQTLVMLPHEELTGDNRKYPLLRVAANDAQRTVSLKTPEDAPPNVVVIIMESFTARLCGACGADRSDDDYSPEFNKLAKQGILFNRCFSVGTHTHQANVGVVADFPNLPGHEALMEDFDLGAQSFDSLPRAFKQRGYDTSFIYNGAFEWENMRGFHSIQGTGRFIGRDDFDQRSYFDHTWGVSDKDLFDRANEEFAKAKKPFYATVLTLSNHAPYEFPRPLPFPEVTDQGGMNERLNGMRYADWALGQFFKRARREPYFRNTLFVLVGDHGYSLAPILTELRLLRFHIPLLFYAPELLGKQGETRGTVASQLDIAPTVLRLVGDKAPHQHWGRDLFSLPPGDPGYAIFKPSESSAEIGFARGDTLLVKSNDGRSQLYRYSLGWPARVKKLGAKQRAQLKAMDQQLQAFVTTAVNVLKQRNALALEEPPSALAPRRMTANRERP